MARFEAKEFEPLDDCTCEGETLCESCEAQVAEDALAQAEEAQAIEEGRY